MGGAPLLLAMAVVMVDPGWESIGPGQYRYIIQVTPEQFETLKAERKLTSRIPENLRGQITEVEIRFGDGPLPRPEIIAASGLQETAFPVAPQDYPRPPDELQPNTMRGQDGGDSNFQIPSMSPSTSPRTTPGTTPSTAPSTSSNNGLPSTGPSSGGMNRNPAAGPATDFQIPATPTTTRPGTTRPNTTQPGTSGNNASTDPYGPTPPPSWSREAATNRNAAETNPAGADPRFAATSSGNTQPGTDPPSMNAGGVDNRGLSEINRRGTRQIQPASTQTLGSQTNSSQINSDDTYKFWDRRSGMTPAEQRQSDQRLVAEVTSNQSGQLIDRSTLRPLAADDPRFSQMLDYLVRIGEITVAEERDLLDWAENLLSKERATEAQRNTSRTAQLTTNPTTFPPASRNTSTSNDSRTLEEQRIREQLLQEQLATERLARERLAQLGAAALPTANQLASNQPATDQTAGGQRQPMVDANRQAEGTTSRTGRLSPSDDEPLVRNQAQLESRPLINFFLLFSLVANAYLMLAVSRLIRRYRNLVATSRGSNGSLSI
ncbi:hypothetical protein SH139x_005158 [Planctomycetaceae bacterium SH139]